MNDLVRAMEGELWWLVGWPDGTRRAFDRHAYCLLTAEALAGSRHLGFVTPVEGLAINEQRRRRAA